MVFTFLKDWFKKQRRIWNSDLMWPAKLKIFAVYPSEEGELARGGGAEVEAMAWS